MIVLPSAKYEEWHTSALCQLPKIPTISLCEITLTFFWPDNRRCDLTNKAESVMDALVDKGIIQDDSWGIVPRVNLISGGVDRGNPRVEVVILPL